MLFRLAIVKDLVILNNLMHLSKGHWGYDEAFMAKFMKNFSLTQSTLLEKRTFIASFHEKDIGFYNFIHNNDGQTELENFFIHPDFMGKGMGRTMWIHCLETARKEGASSFVIWADPHADGFYTTMGCTKIGKRPSIMMPNRFPSLFRYDLILSDLIHE